MADSNVPITPGSGRAVDASGFTIGAVAVDRQRVVIGSDAAAGQLATVKAASAAIAATDFPLAVGLHPSSPIPLPAIAKGVQGATGIAVQRLQDAGRRTVNLFMAAPVAATATETLQPLTGFVGAAAVAAAASPAVVAAGKILRLTSMVITYVNVGTTPVTARVNLRANAAGAVAVGSPLVASHTVGGAAAVAGATATTNIVFPEGHEFAAGTGLGVTAQGFGVTGTGTAAASGYVQVALFGFEY